MPPSSQRFRPAHTGDVGAVARLMAAYYAEDGYAYSEERALGLLLEFVRTPDRGALWVAEVSESIVGYLVVTLGFSFEYGGRDAFIDELYIAEGFRAAGLGREAVQLAEQYCGQMDVRAMHLEVEFKRTTAAALYEKVGFRDNGRRLMTKRLVR